MSSHRRGPLRAEIAVLGDRSTFIQDLITKSIDRYLEEQVERVIFPEPWWSTAAAILHFRKSNITVLVLRNRRPLREQDGVPRSIALDIAGIIFAGAVPE